LADNIEGPGGGILRGDPEPGEGGGALFAFAEVVGGDGEFFEGDHPVGVIGGSDGGVEFVVSEADGGAGLSEVGFIFKQARFGAAKVALCIAQDVAGVAKECGEFVHDEA